MGSRLLLSLAAAISLVQVTVSEPLLVKINKTWSEAQSYCREHYTDLVSIHSAQEMEKINTAVQDVQTERVWIGLFRNNTSQQWHWSNGDYFMYLNWYPYAAQYSTNVAVFNTQWYGLLSTYPFYFICQKVSERDSSALKGYYLVKELKSWTDAQQRCRDEGTDLASIRSPEEQEALNTLTDPLLVGTATFIWIGLYRENSSQPWKWSNGDPIENWDSGEPDLQNAQDACVSMNGNAPGRKLGFWDDRSCTERFYFLCSGAASPATTITTTNNSESTPETTAATTTATLATTTATSATTPATTTSPPTTAVAEESSASSPGPAKPTSSALPDNLYFHTEQKSWVDAVEYCRDQGKDLASITTQDLQDTIDRNLTGTEHEVWIGLRKCRLFGSWFWVNGDELSYTNWGNNSSSEPCTKLLEEEGILKWVSDCCLSKHSFMCQVQC
ncbi:C-type mannose receptor 2-like [Polyodon spathula]|uniref:C-type mannose receptor 2-like n=1 Tax=Polyodon spathula TaxID=7913 RepID=UPI001B7EFC91|nr:C-type mannose receptor 2-like [Polyodon spathula]